MLIYSTFGIDGVVRQFQNSAEESPKYEGDCATLTVYLPSTYSGGKVSFDWRSKVTKYDQPIAAYDMYWVANLKSFDNEPLMRSTISQITKGHKIGLVYSLVGANHVLKQAIFQTLLQLDKLLEVVFLVSKDPIWFKLKTPYYLIEDLFNHDKIMERLEDSDVAKITALRRITMKFGLRIGVLKCTYYISTDISQKEFESEIYSFTPNSIIFDGEDFNDFHKDHLLGSEFPEYDSKPSERFVGKRGHYEALTHKAVVLLIHPLKH